MCRLSRRPATASTVSTGLAHHKALRHARNLRSTPTNGYVLRRTQCRSLKDSELNRSGFPVDRSAALSASKLALIACLRAVRGETQERQRLFSDPCGKCSILLMSFAQLTGIALRPQILARRVRGRPSGTTESSRVPGESVPFLCKPPRQHRTHQQQLLPAPPMRYWSLVYLSSGPSRVGRSRNSALTVTEPGCWVSGNRARNLTSLPSRG